MRNPTPKPIRPRKLCLEASTACQLKCPSCPTALGETGHSLGVGFLKFADFKKIVDENPWVSTIELSNWGEVFLNKDLVKILEYAHRKNVALSAENGANLNHLPEATAEAVVKYRLRRITCSIDGASQETYPIYRVNGDFQRVINNVKTINRFKKEYNSPYPELLWQFIAFGHNEHEIPIAREMARDLNMDFCVKLSWDDLYTDSFSPIKDKELIRRETGHGAATRQEFREEHGREYVLRDCCVYMWNSPQVNHDGRVLGCPINHWADYGNAHEEGLFNVLNNERMSYARRMLQGQEKERADIPCLKCDAYHQMKATGNWLREEEVAPKKRTPRWRIDLGNRVAANPLISKVVRSGEKAARALKRREFYEGGPMAVGRKVAEKLGRPLGITWLPRLGSGIYPLNQPIEFGPGSGWKAIHLFRGRSRSMADLACHMSGLKKGECPHPPHRHNEEEILMVLAGEVEIPLPDLAAGGAAGHVAAGDTAAGDAAARPAGGRAAAGAATIRLKPGELVYYPSFFAHTLTTISDEPARYLMFKWQDDAKGPGLSVAGASDPGGSDPGALDSGAKGPGAANPGAAGPGAANPGAANPGAANPGVSNPAASSPGKRLAHGRFDASSVLHEMGNEDGFRFRQLFQGQTEFLERLECHVTTLSPGAGYPAHADPYDVGIVVLEGELETLGKSVPAGSLIYYAAGEPHGMRNPGQEPARYVVLEFQGQTPLWAKLTDASRWRRKFRRLVGRA